MANQSDQTTSEALEVQVADMIAASGPAVRKKVVNDLAEEVIEHRACLLTESLRRLRSMSSKLEEKDKPDKVCHDANRKKSEHFSEVRVKEIEHLEKGIGKLDPAVTLALAAPEDGKDNKKAWCALEKVLKELKKDYPCCNHC